MPLMPSFASIWLLMMNWINELMFISLGPGYLVAKTYSTYFCSIVLWKQPYVQYHWVSEAKLTTSVCKSWTWTNGLLVSTFVILTIDFCCFCAPFHNFQSSTPFLSQLLSHRPQQTVLFRCITKREQNSSFFWLKCFLERDTPATRYYPTPLLLLSGGSHLPSH